MSIRPSWNIDFTFRLRVSPIDSQIYTQLFWRGKYFQYSILFWGMTSLNPCLPSEGSSLQVRLVAHCLSQGHEPAAQYPLDMRLSILNNDFSIYCLAGALHLPQEKKNREHMLAKDLRIIICCSILMSWEPFEGFLLQTWAYLCFPSGCRRELFRWGCLKMVQFVYSCSGGQITQQ